MMMKRSYMSTLAAAVVAAGLMMSVSITGTAHAHARMVITPDVENAKPISVVLGHTNEPTFGVKSGVHDGKHGVEVFLRDAATGLPLRGAELKVDKYYFKDQASFNRATSPNQADKTIRNVTLSPVFGDPGHYMARQVQQPGIYGYRLYGTIDYFGTAKVPIDTIVFCRMGSESGGSGASGSDTTKFNSLGWSGGYGCTGNINDIYFPQKRSIRPTSTTTATTADGESFTDDGQTKQVILAGSSNSLYGNVAASQGATFPFLAGLQMLVVAASIAAAGFFGIRRLLRQQKKGRTL